MNNKIFFIILLFIILYFLIFIIKNNNIENFICINPETYDNKVCKSNLQEISNPINYCNNNNNCNGYISVNSKDKFNNIRKKYYKCFDNWNGELYQKDLFYDKLKKIYKDYGYEFSNYEFSNLKTYKCGKTCPPGKGIKDDSNTCKDCDEDEYNIGDSHECKKFTNCPEGYLETKDQKTGIVNCIKNIISECPDGYILNSTKTDCIQCDLGEKPNIEGTNCEPCSVGTYGSEKGICTPADIGYYIDLTGQTTQKECEANTFSNTRGASSCSPFTNCVAGQKIKINGDTKNDRECQDCEYGYYSSNTNSSSCSVIEPGHKAVKTNSKNTGQTLCDDNTYSTDEISEDCTPCGGCPDGQYRSGCNGISGGSCTNCPGCSAGKYRINCSGRSQGTCTDCSECPAGQFRSGCNGTSPGTCTDCSECPAGQYRINCNGTSLGTCTNCSECPTGQFRSGCSGTSQGTCTDCPGCPAGQFRINCSGRSQGTCTEYSIKTCGPGQKLVIGDGKTDDFQYCEDCPAGYFNSYDDASTECYECTDGTYSSSSGSHTCYTYTNTCPAGSVLKGGSSTSDKYCETCATGYYSYGGSNTTSCPKCKDCESNEFQTQSCTPTHDRQCSNCTSCGENEYQTQRCTNTQDTQCSTCRRCGDNQYETRTCSGTQNRLCSNCTTCTPNQYESRQCSRTQNRQCTPYLTTCPNGQRLVGGSPTSNKRCEDCPGCPAGQFRSGCNGTSGGSCEICPECPAGKYRINCSGTSQGTCTDCSECPAGQFISGCNGTSPGTCTEYSIKTCVNGQKLVIGDGKTDDSQYCEDCPTGYYSNKNNPNCTQVKAGYKLNSTNSGEEECPAGTYSKAGSTSCSDCEDGKFSSSSRSSSCTPHLITNCGPGKKLTPGTRTNDGICNDCPVGQYKSGTNSSTSCNNCPKNKGGGSSGAKSESECICCPNCQESEVGSACTSCANGCNSSTNKCYTHSSCNNWSIEKVAAQQNGNIDAFHHFYNLMQEHCYNYTCEQSAVHKKPERGRSDEERAN